MIYELQPQSIHVETEYSDVYETTITATISRSDGATGEIWIAAGVPPYLRGTSEAARTQTGYQDVWTPGQSLDDWCPEGFHEAILADRDEIHAILDAVRKPALAAHNERRTLFYSTP